MDYKMYWEIISSFHQAENLHRTGKPKSPIARYALDNRITLSYTCNRRLAMAQTALIQVRVDAELKKEAEALFYGMGLDTSTAVRVFLKQAIAQKSIPFAISSAGEQGELKKRKGLTPGMKNPIHVGPQFKMYSKEKLHER
jgi:DNA-damage-inducible protein J